jgi:hypothetical protein
MFPEPHSSRDFWKAGTAGEAETDDEPDFYFRSHSQPPPPSAAASTGAPRTSSNLMHTPDTSFHVFDDSNSLDTTPRIGKKTRKGAEQTDSLLFPSSFPSEEFLSEMSQQLEKHSVRFQRSRNVYRLFFLLLPRRILPAVPSRLTDSSTTAAAITRTEAASPRRPAALTGSPFQVLILRPSKASP